MKKDIQLVYHYLGRISLKEIFALSLIILVSISYILIPAILRNILIELQSTDTKFDKLLSSCGLLTIIFGLQAIGSFYSRKILISYVKKSVEEIRNNLARLYLSGETDLRSSERISSIHKKFYYDTESVDRYFNSLVTQILPAISISIVVFALMLYINLVLMTAVLLLLIVSYLLLGPFKAKRDQRLHDFQVVFEKFNQRILFILKFKRLISVQAMISEELKKTKQTFLLLNKQGVKMIMGFAATSNFKEFVQSVTLVVVLVLSAWLKSKGSITMESVLIFFFLIYVMRRQILSVSSQLQLVSEGIYALNEIRKLESSLTPLAENQTVTSNTTKKPVQFERSLVFKNVYFNYPNSPSLLEDVNFALIPGKINLIKGENGAGKSTLMLLLLGCLKAVKGEIQIEGIDIKTLEHHLFLKNISVVFQENELFDGTIKDNLLYGVNANESDIEQAICQVGLTDWVDQLVHKLDTEVNELESSISGGQKQRIVIARALLKKPKLLILDEPTNHLDVDFIARLTTMFKELKERMTILLISHDSQLSELADQTIIVHEKHVEVR